MNTEFSIIIPTRNRREYLEEAINSIISQQGITYEIIVVDDCSTDETKEYLLNISRKQSNIKYFRNKKPQFAHNSRKRGYENANGKYVIFMDDDDFYIDNMFLLKAKKIFDEKNNVFTILGGVQTYRDNVFLPYKSLVANGEVRKEEYLNGFLSKYPKPLSTLTAVFRKCGLDAIGLEKSKMINDTCIYLYGLMAGDVFIIDYPVAAYRIHSSNISKRKLPINFIKACMSEKYKLYKMAKNENMLINPKEWYYSQLKVTLDYFLEASNNSGAVMVRMMLYSLNNEKKVCLKYWMNRFKGKFGNDKELKKRVKEIKKYEKVYIYGAGYVGKKVYSLLEKKGINIAGFLVSDDRYDKEYANEMVKPITTILNEKDISLIIIGVSERIIDDIYLNLEKLGFKNIVDDIPIIISSGENRFTYLKRNDKTLQRKRARKNIVNIEMSIGDEKKKKRYNIGDTLGEVIVDWMLEKKGIDKYQLVKKTKHLLTVGSVIGMAQFDATVWGSGILSEKFEIKTIKNSKVVKYDIRAVRGPLTRRVLDLTGYNCPRIYGDPAILMPLIYFPKYEKKYEYSVIFHHSTEIVLDKQYDGINFIDVKTNDYEAFIQQILMSKKIISASLHGIILAEAYGVPTVFLNKDIHDQTFKYIDWYYSTNRYNIKMVSTIEEGISIEPMELPNLTKMQQEIMNVFPYDIFLK